MAIPGYERYLISNQGRIFGFCHDALKEITLDKGSRYYTTRLVNNSGELSNGQFVHRLVAMAFCINDDPDTKTEVHHINGNSLDNRACNLMWVSPQEHKQIHSKKRKADKQEK